jgi:hypothetical protein
MDGEIDRRIRQDEWKDDVRNDQCIVVNIYMETKITIKSDARRR